MGSHFSKPSSKQNYKSLLNRANNTFILYNNFILAVKTQKEVDTIVVNNLLSSIADLQNSIRYHVQNFGGLREQENEIQSLMRYLKKLEELSQVIRTYNPTWHRQDKLDFAKRLKCSDEIASLSDFIEKVLEPELQPAGNNKSLIPDEWTNHIGDHYPKIGKLMKTCFHRIESLKEILVKRYIQNELINELIRNLTLLSDRIAKIQMDQSLNLSNKDHQDLKLINESSGLLKNYLENFSETNINPILHISADLQKLIKKNILYD